MPIWRERATAAPPTGGRGEQSVETAGGRPLNPPFGGANTWRSPWPVPIPVGPQERERMGFAHDTLADGRPLRVLTIVDHGSRSCLVVEMGVCMFGEAVSQVLDRALGESQGHRSITVDHTTHLCA